MKHIRTFFLCSLLIFSISTPFAHTHAATKSLKIVANSASSYSIVYPNGNTTLQTFATTLQTAIQKKTGVTLSVKTDATSASAKEIVLGPTSSRYEHAVIHTNVPTYGYRIGICNEKLIITARDANHMAVALERFEAAILRNTALAGSGFLTFNSENDQYGEFTQSQATLSAIIANNYDYSLTLKTICTQGRDGDVYVAQGCATDGNYFYLCNRTSSDSYCRIYKFTMSGAYVGKSGNITSNHANDITVDTKNGRVVLVHGTGAPTKLSFISTSSLAYQSSMTFGRGIGALGYCPERDMYVGSQGGGCVFYTGANLGYSSSYDTQRNRTSEGSSGYTAQGMGCDRDYVYFPMSKIGTDNILVAYDWNGTYKKTFKINSPLESESMCEYNGRYFINFIANGGAQLNEVVITLKYTTSI